MNIINRVSIKIICFSAFITITGFALYGSVMAEELELDVQSATPGETVVFTISINDAPNLVDAILFEVHFNGDCLTWQSITPGDLTQSFGAIDPATGNPTGALMANEPQPGRLIIIGTTVFNENKIHPGESGVFATIAFTVDACCSTELAFAVLNDDLIPPNAAATWTTKNGQFFCGDADFDGILDGDDNCVETPNPAQMDKDNDGYGNACDNCPIDPNKIQPGSCGCGVPETDTDGDLMPDCIDLCPNDPDKTSPGVCGCGTSDRDSDGDNTPDCNDECPNDPNKTAPGVCGCGTPDTDTDGDGVADCNDECLNDPNKTAPGICGCGTADTDTDDDGTPDCKDNDDSDNDGVKDKHDNCPSVANPGQTDTDNDGSGDACDGCPNDPDKILAGECGCGIPDLDTDGDGVSDCNDACPDNPDKTEPGICGCGNPDIDRDGDGTIDCPSDNESTLEALFGCFLDTLQQ